MEDTGLKQTHPLVLGAAVSVMIVSLVGTAAIGGLLPNAHSDMTDMPTQKSAPTADGAHRPVPNLAARAGDNACESCGTVESIRTVELKGDASGLGAAAGGVTGAVLGNQIGRGNGNTAMTILAAAGGALAGNEIEKNMKKHYTYRVTVRMDDGSFRTISQSAAPDVGVGARVRIAHGALVVHS